MLLTEAIYELLADKRIFSQKEAGPGTNTQRENNGFSEASLADAVVGLLSPLGSITLMGLCGGRTQLAVGCSHRGHLTSD